MILLGIVIFALLFFAACLLGRVDALRFFVDLPALACTLTPIIGYVICCGVKPFGKGLSAIRRLPQQDQPDVADYFQKLIMVCSIGIIIAFTLSVLSVFPFDLELRKQMLTTAILSFSYTGWLTLLVFVPIAYRLAGGIWNTKLRYNFPLWAVLAVTLLSPIFTSTSLNYRQSAPWNVIQEFTDSLSWNYSLVWIFFDVPSIVVMLGTLTACRLALGKLSNRYHWIVFSVFIGVLWTLQGMIFMLSDFKPEHFAPGCAVALLTTLYGIAFALPVLINFSWFFTVLAVLNCVFITVMELRTGYIAVDSPFDGMNIIPTMGVFLMLCVFGRFCDMFFLTITRYESFADLFRKHIIMWILFALFAVMCVIEFVCWIMAYHAGGRA